MHISASSKTFVKAVECAGWNRREFVLCIVHEMKSFNLSQILPYEKVVYAVINVGIIKEGLMATTGSYQNKKSWSSHLSSFKSPLSTANPSKFVRFHHYK